MSCGYCIHSVSNSHSNSWNIGFIICSLQNRRLRPQDPKSLDQHHTRWGGILLAALVGLSVKYHLFGMFASWIAHLFIYLLATIWTLWLFKGISHLICKTGSHCPEESKQLALSAWFSACAEIMYQCRGSCRLVVRGAVVLVTASSSQWYGASCPNWLMLGDLSYLLCSPDSWLIFFLLLWPSLPLSSGVLLCLLPVMPLLLESVRAAFLDSNQELSSMLLRNPGYLLLVGVLPGKRGFINRNGTEGEGFTLLFFTIGLKASETWRTSLVGSPKECERRLRGTVEKTHAWDSVEFFLSQSLPGPVNSCYGIFWDSDTLSPALGGLHPSLSLVGFAVWFLEVS